eukprot:Blabericola_migrator_1__8627@NODE_451_length_8357_cov_69_379252_g353_i0_p9_GENE_NODE_451_length_8357_cov_69_379252_g353_i0NODE_451_length_8357_cov_69_379252_g353_i0_p9_ORF_typecomplete_len130_score19_09TetR_C_20/PF17925_1/0_0083_NODE_451_length_8357_cov_69_379252_g353_i064766865
MLIVGDELHQGISQLVEKTNLINLVKPGVLATQLISQAELIQGVVRSTSHTERLHQTFHFAVSCFQFVKELSDAHHTMSSLPIAEVVPERFQVPELFRHLALGIFRRHELAPRQKSVANVLNNVKNLIS